MQTAFIGSGAMGGAIAKGFGGADSSQELRIYDVNNELATETASRIGSHASATSLDDALCGADIALLAVKPQVQTQVIKQVSQFLEPDTLVVSIAAGRTLQTIGEDFAKFAHPNVPIVRVMPNVNAQVGASMTALAANSKASDAHRRQVESIFNSVGTTIWLPESQFSVFTALAGSSPAWFYQIVDVLARAGVSHGLTKAAATQITAQSMLGSALMLQTQATQGIHPGELVDRVCSPAGTTVAGLLAAQEAGLATALTKAVDATVRRDQDLGK